MAKNRRGPAGSLASKPHLLWQGNTTSRPETGLSTGFPELDQVLPGNGWPRGALIEMVVPYWGIGELRLLLPAMIDLNRQRRQIVWIAPPYLPYAPALKRAGLDLQYVLVVDASSGNISWAMERLLYTESCGMVLAWPVTLSDLETRRLQLAGAAGGSIGVVLHTRAARWRAASAATRLRLDPLEDALSVSVVKARGTCGGRRVAVKIQPPAPGVPV